MTVIRVMTFNINGNDTGPERNWAARAAFNAQTIRRYSPDLIGLQEVVAPNIASYQEHLPEYAYELGQEYDEGQYAAHSSIFWKQGRFDRIESGKFWFSRTPDVRSSDWGVPYPMGATWVRLQDRETGAHLLHLNAHFEDGPDGELSRLESSKLMVERIDQVGQDIPVIVTGDFNCNPWSAPYKVFTASGFTDTFRDAGHSDSVDSSTFHAYRGAQYFALEWGSELFWRVDWILTRMGSKRFQTSSCTIVRDAAPPLYPSDHYPVVSETVLM